MLIAILHACFFSAIWGNQTFLESARDAPSILWQGAWTGTPPAATTPKHAESTFNMVSDPGAPAWQTEPWFAYIGHEYLHKHTLPLWNPYQGFGQPLAANVQAEPFYPLTVALALHLTPRTYNFYILLRLFTAGFCTFLYLRFIVSFLPALGGAIAAMLGGYFVVFVTMPHLSVETLIPASLLAAEYLLRRQSFRAVVWFSLVILLVWLGGFPESAVLLFGLEYAYLVFRVATDPELRAMWIQRTVQIAGATVAGFGLAAFSLLPFLAYMGRSFNAHDPKLLGGLYRGLAHDPPNLSALTYLFPLMYGPVNADGIVPGQPALRNYVGVAVFFFALLAVLAAVVRRRGEARMLNQLTWFFFGACLFVVLKRYGLLGLNNIGRLPFLRMLDFPKYDEALLSVCAAILCAIGLERLRRRDIPVGTQCTALFLAFAFVPYAVIRTRKLLYRQIFDAHVVPGLPLFALVVPVCVLVLLGICLVLFNSSRKERPAILLAMVSLVAVELGFNYIAPVYHFFNKLPEAKMNPYAGAPYVAFLQHHAGDEYRIFARDGVLMPDWASAFQLADIRDIDAMFTPQYFPFLRTFFPNYASFAPDLMSCFRGLGPFDFKAPLERRLLQLASVKYIASAQPYVTPNPRIAELLRQNEGHLQPGREQQVGRTTFDIGLSARETLGEHPPYERLPYRIHVPTDQPTFHFSYGIHPGAWNQPGDGVTFRVELRRPDGHIVPLLDRYIDPKHDPAVRRWMDAQVNLAAYRGKDVDLLFSTDPGPRGDTGFDWAGWSDFHFEGEQSSAPLFRAVYDNEVAVSEYQEPVLPRAAIFGHVDLVPTDQEALKTLAAPSFRALESVAVNAHDLTANERTALEEMNRQPAEPARPARITRYGSEAVQISAALRSPGVLMLNDSTDPGWTVAVDGHAARWFSADYMFRGVLLGAGDHVVRWTYRPASFRFGSLVSFMSALVLLSWGLIRKMRPVSRARRGETVPTSL